MSLAKWIGLGSAQHGVAAAASPVKGAADANPAELAKVSALTPGECKRFGFENFGNTCYVNSVLQALYFCHPFRELVIHAYDRANHPISANSSPYPSSANHHSKGKAPAAAVDIAKFADGALPATMFDALRALFLQISNNAADKGTISPRSFVDKLRKENELFRTTMHQDAHEFLIYLLNKIAEDLEEEARNARSRSSSGDDLTNSVVSAGPSTQGTLHSNASSSASTLVQDLFEGVLTSETRCLTCETVSARDEAFLDLSIDIEQNSSVTACLRQFSASEMLCQKNKFFCDSCCGLQEAEKRMKIKRLPNVLALHLKRFKYQEDVGRYTKLAYRVAFPLELRLFNTVDDAQDPDRLYELFAIVVHIGNGPHHGHYVAIVKSRESWVVFDDDTVDVIKESDISKYFGDSNSGCAYVLYYQAVDMDLAALGLRAEETPAHGSVSELSPLQTPLLPPGLTHEGDSDASASEIAPKTPASPFQTPAVAPSTPPSLTVTIPASEGGTQSLPIPIPIPSATPPKSAQSPPPLSVSPNGRTGFFTLRNKASKPSIEATKLFNVAGSPPPMPPPPASSGTISSAGSPQVSASPSQASTVTDSISHLVNGKIKVPKEKASGWFKRSKSVKPEKSRNTSIQRPGTASGTTDGSTSHTSSSTSLPNPSAPAQSSAIDISTSASQSKTQSRPLPSVPSSDTPRSSSHQSSPPKPHTVLVPSTFPLAPSTSRTSDHTEGKSPQNKSSAVLVPSRDLSPEAGPSKSKSTSPPPAFATAPRKRPSTAGGALPRTHMNGSTMNGTAGKRELVARRSQESFVPPLPSDNTGFLPGAPAVRPRLRNGSSSPSPARGSSPADERIRWRSSAASGSANGHALNGISFSGSSGDIGASPNAHVGPTLSSAPVTPLVKRASRKLSFSGGMGGILGLGRKDKDKDKDAKDRGRERDRERQRASVFSAASMSPPSIVPGLSSAGRY